MMRRSQQPLSFYIIFYMTMLGLSPAICYDKNYLYLPFFSFTNDMILIHYKI